MVPPVCKPDLHVIGARVNGVSLYLEWQFQSTCSDTYIYTYTCIFIQYSFILYTCLLSSKVRSQMTQLSMSHSNRSMEHQVSGDDFEATDHIPHSLEPSELRRSPTGEYHLSGQHQLSRQHQQLQQPQLTGQRQVSRQHQQLQQPQFTGQRQLSVTGEIMNSCRF